MRAFQEQTILVVDDEQKNVLILESLLAPLGHRVISATSGKEALERIEEESPDLVLLDVMMPGMDGFEVCRTLKNEESTRLIPVVMVTALDDVSDKVRAFESDADDFLTKPVNRHELRARVRSCLRIKSLNDQLECSESVLFAFVEAMEARDAYTVGHSRRVAEYTVDLGRAAGLSPESLDDLERGGLLHDIGKIGIPDAVLQKQGPLAEDEQAIVRQHPVIGEKICRPLRSFDAIRPLIRSHHERLDGSGYPDGLRGDAISLEVRILSIADTFDALTSNRPYRKGLETSAVETILRSDVERPRLDGSLVELAIERFPRWLEISATPERRDIRETVEVD